MLTLLGLRIVGCTLMTCALAGRGWSESIVVTAGPHHLRSGKEAEWTQYAEKIPEGSRLDISFESRGNAGGGTLVIHQEDVKLDWRVELNGRKVGELFLMESPLVWTLPVGPGVLKEGTNRLSIVAPKENDDIVVGPIRWEDQPPEKLLDKTRLSVAVREEGKPIPCRVTIVNENGALAAVRALRSGWSMRPEYLEATRPGVVYTGDGKATVGLLPGRYTVYASRGLEYSVDERAISLAEGESARVDLRIRREVPTEGWVACDHHMHTLTYGGHGDATIDERMLTLAGEGVELPISTEHNLLVDFSGAARRTGMRRYFTPVIGCEVTTREAHFNAFPVAGGARPPDHRIADWGSLMSGIRATPGVRFIVLNHPCDEHSRFIPMASTNVNLATGDNRWGLTFGFDGFELLNSGALRSDYMEPCRAWFALLNHGYHLTAVAGSDGHDVSRFIVGQGRTYIAASDKDPANIDVNECVDNLQRGRALVSMGLVVDMGVGEGYRVGDLATNIGPELPVRLRVLGPSWATADRVELYANGLKIRESSLTPTTNVLKGVLTWNLPRPAHDVFLVAIATGPGVTKPFWAIPRPYQPSSPAWEPRVFASTNPIWIDADGDGRFSSAREYAQGLVRRHGKSPRELLEALEKFDAAVAAQAAGLSQAAGANLEGAAFSEELGRATAAVRDGFGRFRDAAEALRSSSK